MSSNREIRKADVLLVGRFDRNATMGCFGPRFWIRVTSAELKSPVTVEPLPKRDEERRQFRLTIRPASAECTLKLSTASNTVKACRPVNRNVILVRY
jgi:hypothetical protein